MDWERATAELTKKLDPAAVKPPPRGKFGEYVDGLHVISEANRIFGHGGWSYEITRLEQASLQTFDLADRDGAVYQQVRAAYICTVKVNVGGTIREGAAVGTGNGKPENIGDVIESAVKEAETDALKRALRCFGNTFGLALYEKDKAKRQVGVDKPPVTRDPRAVADSLIAKMDGVETWDALNRLRGDGTKFSEAWEWLELEKPAMAAEVKAAETRAEARVDPARQAP